MKKYLLPLISFLFLFAIDQGSKWAAYHFLRQKAAVSLVGDAFVLEYLENRGAAFGMLQNKRIFLVCLTILILACLIAAYIKLSADSGTFFVQALLVLLAAGAVGNLWDRMVRGYVIDFLYFKLINFPIFNIADCYVVIAAVGIALYLGFYDEKKDKHV
jgi:signal peptidase II